MIRTGIYPGTFDPITFGHIDVIKKSLKIVDKLIVAISDSSEKDYLFSTDERIEILKKSLFKDLKLKKNKIKIVSFQTLTVKLCNKFNASIIIRGLRAVSDFEYEFQLAGMNKKLDDKIETIFLMSNIENEIISSNQIEVFKVGEIVTIKTNNFKFEKNWQGFDKLSKGSVIGKDGDEIIYAPFEETILIMPTKRLFPGKTAVRLAYNVD